MRSPSDHKALEERLELSVAEAHHRVKNTLQNVISYINVMFARRETIHKEEIEKLVKFVRSLGSLHDFLRDSSDRKDPSGLIRLDILMKDIFSLHALDQDIDADPFPQVLFTARRAATLALIMTELLDNAARFGTGNIRVEIMSSSPTTVTFKTSNVIDDTKQSHHQGPSLGLDLAKKLAQADFGIPPIVTTENGKFEVILSLPFEQKSPTDSSNNSLRT